MGRNPNEPKPTNDQPRPNRRPVVPRPRQDTEPGDVRLVMECPYKCGVVVRSHVAEIIEDVLGVHVYLWHEWQFRDQHRRLPEIRAFA